MNFSSILLSLVFHTGIFLSLITFFTPELRQINKIHHDLVSFQIIETDIYEKQKQNEILVNKQFKIYQHKKNESIQKLIKKNQSTRLPNTKSRVIKEKNFEVKKKEIKKIKSLGPQIKKNLYKDKLVSRSNIFNEKPSMSVIPNIQKFRSAKLNQKFYGCSKSKRSKLEKKNKKDSSVNKNITISNLLGYIYNYDPNYINISNLLKSYQVTPQKNINITELLNKKIDSIEVCN